MHGRVGELELQVVGVLAPEHEGVDGDDGGDQQTTPAAFTEAENAYAGNATEAGNEIEE